MSGQPCSDCASQGAYSKLLMEPGSSPHTFDSSSERYEFLAESLTVVDKFGGGNQITGYPDRVASKLRRLKNYCKGSIWMNVCPSYFANLLPRMIGPLDTGVYQPTGCPTAFGILIERDNGVFTYSDCYVASWELSATEPSLQDNGEPEMLVLRLDLIAKLEELDGDTWPDPEPALGTADGYTNYILSDSTGAVTLAGSARPIQRFRLWYDHGLKPRFRNSTTISQICPGTRRCGLNVVTDWNSTNEDLYNQDPDGAAASIAFTIESMSTVFSFTRLTVPDSAPNVRSKWTDVMLNINGEGACTTPGTNFDLTATNDATN